MISNANRDANLLVVAAVTGYSLNHGITGKEALSRFDRFGIVKKIRDNYETLHTQSLDESTAFAEDILTRMSA
jgi:hypothetical protein